MNDPTPNPVPNPVPDPIHNPTTTMRTEVEVREKLAWLQAQVPNFTDPNKMKRLQTDINRVKWFLLEGPDHILVP